MKLTGFGRSDICDSQELTLSMNIEFHEFTCCQRNPDVNNSYLQIQCSANNGGDRRYGRIKVGTSCVPGIIMAAHLHLSV